MLDVVRINVVGLLRMLQTVWLMLLRLFQWVLFMSMSLKCWRCLCQCCWVVVHAADHTADVVGGVVSGCC